jgi:hypothetical protein
VLCWHQSRYRMGMPRLPLLAAVAVAGMVALGLSGVPAVPAAAATAGGPRVPGTPWQPPAQSAPRTHLAVLGQGSQASAEAQTERASAQARATGKPVPVTRLTTATTTVTAQPSGTEVARTYVLPVRVRRGSGWAPVDKNLRLVGGRLAPVALPGDAVTFSAGGSAPMAVISASGTRLELWWPKRLPVPVVSGPSATYRNVLAGVDLVLTATSASAGGFSEVLVVRTPAAARDRGLAGLALRVASSGTTGLRPVAGGGLAATMTGRRGSYIAQAPVMWDSESVSPLARSARPAAAAARSVGAGLAPAGSGPRSTVAGPAGGARLAPVRAEVSRRGTVLGLAANERMLISPSTRYPVYIDPSFTTIPASAGTQDTDVVQSDDDQGGGDDVNCTGPHFNDSSYSDMPVGYDNFQAGDCEFNDTDYALYQVGIPAGIFASQHVLLSASFQTAVAYSSSCASANVTASWVGEIGSGTGWPGPPIDGRNVSEQPTSVGYSNGSCDTVEDTDDTVAAGFNLLPDLVKLMGTSVTAITLRLWENYSNEDDHKQFTKDPDIQVVYTETPNTPSDLEESATSTGTGSVACATTEADAPWIGKTDSVSGVYLAAKYGDPDGGAVQANIKYWDITTTGTTTTTSAATTVDGAISNATASAEDGWQLPASYTDDMTDGTVVAWQAQAETGSGSVAGTAYGPYSSAWSPACYFAVDPTDPDPPVVTGVGQTQDVPVGSTVTFTIAQSDTAKEFVWAVDQTAPTADIPATQTCTTTAATADCSEITGGEATLTIPVTAPGPHLLSVYQVDVAGNDSGTASGAPAGSNSAFSGAGDPSVSFTSGASLQANFNSALGAGQSFDNTMISTKAGSPGAANGDGTGDALDEAQLAADGWSPGGNVTIDGATFTLPGFGASASGPDNLLSANQTIGTGTAGAQGSALIVLATSTNGDVVPGGLATGQPDTVLASDTTAPAVMGTVPVTGNGCDGSTAFNATTGCQPATANINYASASGCPEAPVPYTLTVPDWVRGPTDISALTLPDWDTASGQQAQSVKIYAFAIPLDPSCTVTSVSLPDVAASATGLTQPQPALHIFGLAMRNTTTATPEVNGTSAAAPAGQAWTGAFEAPIQDSYSQAAGTFGNETIRMGVSSNVTVPAGAQIRIRLSDPGFTSPDGAPPLQIGAATIATSYYGSIPGQTPVPLTFGGATSVTIPAGGDVYSDPLTLPFAITGGQPSGDTGILVSLYIANASVPYVPTQAWPSGGSEWVTAVDSGNQTESQSATPFSSSGGGSWYGGTMILSGIDVTTPAETLGGVASPGEPTVVVAGDNIIDGWTSGNHAQSDVLDNPSQRLAGQIASQGYAAGYGVVDAGISVNMVPSDLPIFGGMSLLARLDRDVLSEPDVGTVVLDEGLEDVLYNGGSAAVQNNVEQAYGVLANQLGAFGINVIIGDLTPCGGYSSSASSCSAAVETARKAVNTYVDGYSVPPGSPPSGAAMLPPCPAGFDAAVSASTSADPEVLQSAYDAGDHVNLTLGTSGGYAQLAKAVNATGCIAPNVEPVPPAP